MKIREPKVTKPVYVGDANLFFFGKRLFIHGTLMFARFLDAIDRVKIFDGKEEIEVIQFNMRKELREQDGIVEVILGKEEPESRNEPLIARMKAIVGDQPATFSLYEDAERKVTKRDFHEREKELVRSLETTGSFEGSCILTGVRNNFEMMRAIVEANKQFHMSTLGGENPTIRWVYLKGLRLPRNLHPQPDLSTIFRHLSATSYGSNRFTRNEFVVQSERRTLVGEICYKYDLRPRSRESHQ